MNDVGLNHEVFVQKLPAIDIVGVNSADFGSREVHMIRLFGLKKSLHRCLVGQVQFTP